VTTHRSPRRRRLGLRYAGLAFASLAGGILAGAASQRFGILFVLAGFAGYLFHGKRAAALLLGRAGRLAPTPFPKAARRSGPRLIVASVLGLAWAPAAHAQQTIFNVPSTSVLDPGKVYVEVDELFRPTEPSFSSTTVRGVVGVFPRVEAGVNFGGLVSPGPVVPTATVAVKLQPVRAGDFTVTAGGYGLFYLRGSEDGNPAGMGYGFVSYRLPKFGTQIEFGGWYASAGFVHPPHRVFGSSTGGALATFEQPLPWVKGLTLAADWWSGENAIGYVSPGFYWTFGHWTAYAAYSIKNGDSKGNGGLVELGYAF
jgi:hypothetical protein